MGHYDNLYDQENESFHDKHKKIQENERKIEKQFKDRLGKLLNIDFNDDENMRILVQMFKKYE